MARRATSKPPDEEHLAELVVVGDEVDIGLAAELTGLTPAQLLGRLDAAQRAGLVTVDRELVRFDPERRARVYRELGLEGQARAHAHAAAVIERARPHDSLSIARQRAGAVAVLGIQPVLEGIEAAAGDALRVYDWRLAAELLGEAAALARSGHDSRLDQLNLARARALYSAGLSHAAIAACLEVARSARARRDMELLAEAALVVRGIDDQDVCAAMLDMLGEATPALSAGSPLQTRAVAQRAMLEAQLNRTAADLDTVRAALHDADASGDPRAIIECLHAVQMAKPGPQHVGERLKLADRMESLAREAGLDEYLRWPLAWRVDALFQLGSRPALDDAIGRLEEYGQARNDGLTTWRARAAQATLAQVEGRFADSNRLADEALELAQRGGHAMGVFIYGIQHAYFASLTDPQGSRLADFPIGSQAEAAFPAMQAALAGDLEKAAILFERAWPARGQLAGHDLEVPVYSAMAMCAAVLERSDIAVDLRGLLEPFATEMAVVANGQGGCAGPVSLYMAEMAALAGEWETMETDFALALRRCMEFGDRPALARTRYEWARGLLRRGLVRDRERAAPLLDAVERDAAELGMKPLLAQVRHLRDQMVAGRSHPLSARELEVARLVAEGLTNREVASRLHLSVRTVESHLLNSMTKLGLANRAQVTAWVTRAQAAGSLP